MRQSSSRWSQIKKLVLLASVLSSHAGVVRAQTGSFNWDGAGVSQLYPGVQKIYVETNSPRVMHIYCIRIDTTQPGLKFYTTGRYEPYVVDVDETWRRTVRNFLKDSRNAGKPMVLAINATAWTPWGDDYPLHLKMGETTANLTGLAISEGTLVSPADGKPSLLVDSNARLDMQKIPATDDPDVRTAVAGISANWCLRDGSVVDSTTPLDPRTGYGLSSDARYLYWMIIDGRRVSEGAYVAEVGAWLKYFGADDGINMDGGGSSTLVWWNPAKSGTDKTEILNTVSDYYERPTGNGLGIYFATNGLMPTAVCAVTAPPQGLFSTLPVSFDGGGSQDADGSIVNYAWMFGDGTQGSGSPVSHSYAQAGSYTCTLMVTDNDGNTARTNFPIQIEDVTSISLVGGGIVGGDVILKNNAHFAFLLADSPNYQTPFSIGGSLDLGPGGVLDITPIGTSMPDATYTLAVASNGVSGNIATINMPTNWQATVQVAGSNLQLVVVNPGWPADEFWRWQNFNTRSNSGDAADGADPDEDHMTNQQEFLAGTDPNSDLSFLGMLPLESPAGGSEFVIRWKSVAGKFYTLERSTNLLLGFNTSVKTHIPATAPTNSETDTNAAGYGSCFYRIRLEVP
jgi:hypothetical protein